jgi:hypothetical protein
VVRHEPHLTSGGRMTETPVSKDRIKPQKSRASCSAGARLTTQTQSASTPPVGNSEYQTRFRISVFPNARCLRKFVHEGCHPTVMTSRVDISPSLGSRIALPLHSFRAIGAKAPNVFCRIAIWAFGFLDPDDPPADLLLAIEDTKDEVVYVPTVSAGDASALSNPIVRNITTANDGCRQAQSLG